MSEASVSEWIGLLASADPNQRAQAAHELFRLGCNAAEPVLRNWFANPEFRALARSGSSLLTVGIAVEPARFDIIRARFGQPRLAEAPADQDVIEFELEFPHGVRLDVLTTRAREGDGAIARFLVRFGEGLQQVECDVRDIARATEILRSNFALEPIYPAARAGADQTRVNFFLVSIDQSRKILIELVEVAPQKKKK
jgi:hypothetical protein